MNVDQANPTQVFCAWKSGEAIFRFHLFLESMGVIAALEEAGVKAGDTVFIGDVELAWEDWGTFGGGS